MQQDMQQGMQDNAADAHQEAFQQEDNAADIPDLNQPMPADIHNQMANNITA
jgi:hypothetical protein